MDNECFCATYSKACNHKPGWFRPGQLDAVAKFLHMSVKHLFRKKLAIDWYENFGEGSKVVFVIAPVITGERAGREYPDDPRGRCIFYKDDKCEIHTVKPFECAEYIHTDTHEDTYNRHTQIAAMWENEQAQIRELLGREPIEEEFTGGIFSMFS